MTSLSQAAALALEEGKAVGEIAVSVLQSRLAERDVLIHFDDAWIEGAPDKEENYGHI